MVSACAELKGEVLVLEETEKRVFTFVTDEGREVAVRLRLVSVLTVRKDEHKSNRIFILNWHKLDQLLPVTLWEGRWITKGWYNDVFVDNRSELLLHPLFKRVDILVTSDAEGRDIGRIPRLMEVEKLFSDSGTTQTLKVTTVKSVVVRLWV